jgi:hypothetical protein
LKENNFKPRILYPAKLSFVIEGVIKPFHNNQKQKLYMTTKFSLQKILKVILHTDNKDKHDHERKGTIKSQL